MDKPKITDFIPELVEALEKELTEAEKRWGDTWLNRTRKGQEGRDEKRFQDYFDQFKYNGIPVPWLSIIGNSFICWIRDNHPEYFPDYKED